jgi:hypothetical protein
MTASTCRGEVEMTRIVVLAAPNATPHALADFYREQGAEVTIVAARSEPELTQAVTAMAMQPVDLLICAAPPPAGSGSAAGASREALVQSLHDLTFLPVRAAVLLRPSLALAKGRAVLLTDARATMAYEDEAGLYLWRPFIAAAHALWRCLAVEWQADGIACPLIAIDGDEDAAKLAERIGSAPNGSLVDPDGRSIGW